MANDVLGELDVVIGADWSDLQSAINEAISASEAGAKSIQEAFSDTDTFTELAAAIGAVTEALSQVGTAATGLVSDIGDAKDTADDFTASSFALAQAVLQVTEEMNDAGDAATTTADAIGDISDSAAEAQGSVGDLGDAASNASSSLVDMADAVTQVADDSAEASTSVGDFADSAGQAGDDAATATAGVQAFADAEQEAGESGETAGSGISVFRASLLELAEGLAVTEGLKDLAEGALEAYSSIQTATVSLTALTGSADTAGDMIEQLEQKSLQIPVALESLVGATQQMTAFGFSAQEASELVTDAANASAASGKSFDAVTSSLERLALAGTAGARQLATLGLSSQSLATAMTQFGVAGDASAKEVQTAFKNLDVDQRIQVLDTALQGFGGIAAAQAQTVAGEWQILKNQFDIFEESVGADLAPLAEKFIHFASSVVSAGSTVIDEFAKLPEPIQDLAAVALVSLGASGPILTGLAGLSLAVIGLQSIPEVFARLTESIGLAGDAGATAAPLVAGFAKAETEAGAAGALAAPGVDKFAVAETTAGEAAVGAEVGEFGTAIAGAGEAGIAAGPGLIAVGAAIATWALVETIGYLTQLGQKVNDLSTASINANPPLTQTGQVLNGVTATTHAWTGELASSSTALINQTDKTTQLNTSLTRMITPMLTVASTTAGLATVSAGAEASLAKTEATVEKLQKALTDAQGGLVEATSEFKAGEISATGFAAAQTAVTKAQTALDSEVSGKAIPALQGYKQAMADMAITTVPTFASAVESALDKIISKSNDAYGELQIMAGAFVTVSTDANASADQVEAVNAKLQTALKATGNDFDALGADLVNAMKQSGVTLQTVITQFETLQTSGVGSAQDIAQAWQLVLTLGHALGLSLNDIVTAVNNVQASVGGMNAVITNGKIQLTGMTTALDGTTLSVNSLRAASTTAKPAVAAVGTAAQAATPFIQNVGQAAIAASSQIGNAGGGLTFATSMAGAALSKMASYAPATVQAVSSVGLAAVGSSTAVDAYGKSLTTTEENTTGFTEGQQQVAQIAAPVQAAFNFTSTAVDAYGKALTTTTPYVGQFADTVQDTVAVGDKFISTFGVLTPTVDTFGQGIQQVKVQTDDANGAVSDITVRIQGLGDQTDVTTTSVGDFNDSVQDSGVYADSAQGALQTLASNYATAGNAAATAAGQIDQFNGAVSQSSSGGKGGGGNNAEELDAEVLAIASDPATAAFVWGSVPQNPGTYASGPDNISIPGTSTADAQAILQAALDATTSSTNMLSHALTGGSLAPSLDTTTEAVTGTDTALGSFSSTLTTAANNARTAGASITAPGGTAQFGASYATPAQPSFSEQNLANLIASTSAAATQPLTGGLADNSALSLADFDADTGTESIAITPATTTTAGAFTPTGDTTGANLAGTAFTAQDLADALQGIGFSTSSLPSQSDQATFTADIAAALAEERATVAGEASISGQTSFAAGGAGANPFTNAQIQQLAEGLTVASGALTTAQVAAVSQAVAAYIQANPTAQAGQATGPISVNGASSTSFAPGGAGANPLSADQIKALAEGESVSTGNLTVAQVAAINQAVAAYIQANPTQGAGVSSSGISTGNIGGTPATAPPQGETLSALAQAYQQGSISFLQYQQMAAQLSTPDTSSSVYGSGPPVGGSPSGGGNTSNFAPTVNITGMTPSNAQTVIGQMVTSLRQLGSKI